MMIIVIDAYNILKQITARSWIEENERSEFIHILKQYTHIKKHKLLVVFDGGGYEWPHKEKVGTHLTVIFSGNHETADDYIMNFITNNAAKDLLLVSSDHELGLFASHKGKPSINATDFFSLVKDTLKHKVKIVVPQEIIVDSDDLDILMKEASRHAAIKEEDTKETGIYEETIRTKSKTERKLWEKLKKL